MKPCPRGLLQSIQKHSLVCTHGLVLKDQHIPQVRPCKLPLEECHSGRHCLHPYTTQTIVALTVGLKVSLKSIPGV